MNKSTKFYIFFAILLGFSIAAVRASDQVSNYYENSVATNVCEGDSNIIKAVHTKKIRRKSNETKTP